MKLGKNFFTSNFLKILSTTLILLLGINFQIMASPLKLHIKRSFGLGFCEGNNCTVESLLMKGETIWATSRTDQATYQDFFAISKTSLSNSSQRLETYQDLANHQRLIKKITPSGKYLLTSSTSGSVTLFDLTSGKKVWRSKTLNMGSIYSVDIHPTQTLLAITVLGNVGEEITKKVFIYDFTKKKNVKTMTFQKNVGVVAFDPSGSRLAVAARDGAEMPTTLYIVDWKKRQVVGGGELPNTSRIDQLAFSADGKTILTRSSGKFSIKNADQDPNDQPIMDLPLQIYTESGYKNATAKDFHYVLKAWDIEKGEAKFTVWPVVSFSLSTEAQRPYIVVKETTLHGNYLILRSIEDGSEMSERIVAPRGTFIESFALSSDGRHLVFNTSDDRIYVQEIE